MRFLFLAFACIATAACSASTTTDGTTEETSNTSTVAFAPDRVVATRSPAAAACGENGAAFSDDDLFDLQAVRTTLPAEALKSVAVTFTPRVVRGVPLDLAIGGPVRGATFANAEHAHSPDEKTGVGVVAFRADGAPTDALVSARVTVLAVAAEEGDPLTARVELHFASGDVLDQTFTGAVTSYAGACGASP